MTAYNPGTRADVLASIPERFDENWTGYKPDDLAAIRAMAPLIKMRDDADSVYFARSLDYVSAKNIDVLRTQSGIDLLVPTSREIPVGAESVIYKIYDAVGMARVIGSNVDDLPRVDVRAIERSARVQTLGVSFAYTFQEMRTAAYSGSGLPTRKAAIARDVVDRKHNNLKVKGDLAFNIYGLVNHPNIPAVVPATGLWGGAATAENIVDDTIALVNTIYTQSKGNFRPTVIGMPFQLRMAAMRKRMTGSAQMTAFAFIQQTFPSIEFVEVQELAGAGAGGNHVMIAADRNPNYYAYELVMEFTQHPPQPRNLEMVINCESQTAGVIITQPLALAKMEGL